ncbi:glutathione S-transferase [Undibacter mobilis]|uniref:Glutathione S-transferase n=1 Tax=Undibacter mobilis TaxID=2292256 RepID=A0A371BBA9_9BRAD|nr:glutathione S-transferase [Undibacter mobilis]RDV04868.1 glutathione S-transferase [Undibacter mobilis]
MMILRHSPASPFVRKVKIAADVLGLADQIKLEDTDTIAPESGFLDQNALGKIPTLILEDGSTLFDSRVIVEYLDHLAGGGRILPKEPKARFAALRLQALCDGILEATLLIVYEGRFRTPEMRFQAWLDRQQSKTDRALAVLEAAPPALTETPDVGQIALACALGYLDLRLAGAWRKNHPKLVTWLDQFAARVPAFARTKAPT